MGNLGFNCGIFLFISILAMSTRADERSEADCLAVSDQLARLACYDELHGRPSAGIPETQATDNSSIAPVSQEPKATREASPGLPPAMTGLGAEQIPKKKADKQHKPDHQISSLRAMGKGMTGRHWFRLDNDQLWDQVSPERTTLKVGDTIRISRGLMSTYHLRREDGSSRSTSVRRRE